MLDLPGASYAIIPNSYRIAQIHIDPTLDEDELAFVYIKEGPASAIAMNLINDNPTLLRALSVVAHEEQVDFHTIYVRTVDCLSFAIADHLNSPERSGVLTGDVEELLSGCFQVAEAQRLGPHVTTDFLENIISQISQR